MADILQQKLVSDGVRVKIECDESYKGRISNSVIGLFQPPGSTPAQSVGSVTKRSRKRGRSCLQFPNAYKGNIPLDLVPSPKHTPHSSILP